MTEANGRSTGHWVGVGIILAVAWLFLVIGVFGVYLHRSVYNEGVFTKRVAAVLDEPAVQAAVATQISNEVVKAVPDAVIARPLIQSAAQAVVAEPAFQTILVTALRGFHAVLLDPRTEQIVLRIEGAPQLIQTTLQPFDPELAEQLSGAVSTELAALPDPGPTLRLVQIGSELGPVAWVALILGLVIGAGGVLIAPDRRRGAIAALLALAIVGLTVVFLLGLMRVGLAAGTAGNPVLSEGLGGVFDGLFGDLRRTGYIVAAIGIVAAVVLWSLRRTLPYALEAGERARELGAASASVAAEKAASASAAARSAVDSAAGHARDIPGEQAATAAATSAGTAVAEKTAAVEHAFEAQDLMLAVKHGVRKLVMPASSTKGLLLQGAIALVIAIGVLFAWSTVVDVLVIALGLALIALALNRILLVVFEHRGRREAEQAIESGSE